jgi:hypothetical protein
LFLCFAAGNFRRGIPTGYALLWQLVKMSLGLAAITVAFLFTLGFLLETKAINNWIRNPYVESRKAPPKQPRPAAKMSSPVQLDPVMAQRYGLAIAPGFASTNPAETAAASSKGVTSSVPAGFLRMDPVMAKRYGLMVRPAVPTNSPARTP